MGKNNGVLDLANETLSRLSSFFVRFKEERGRWVTSFLKRHEQSLITLLWLFIASLCIFGYTLVAYGMTIPLSGDGYLQFQTMPYQMWDIWHDFFETGRFVLWDTSTGFGVDTIGANSFYGLFSPFTLLTLPFPRSALPQLVGIGYIAKLVIGGFFFYLYLHRMFRFTPSIARVGAIAFAFCGWVTYYLWFATYFDSFAFFPLIFWGIEKILQERDPRLLIAAFALEGLCNFFFFVVFMIGALFYSVFRYACLWKAMGSKEVRWAVFGMGFASFALGILLSSFILLPGIANAQAMPRVESSSYLDNFTAVLATGDVKEVLKIFFLFNYGNENIAFKAVYPLNGFVFMNLASFNNNLLSISYYDNMSGSSYVFLPVILLAFSGYLYAFKKRRISVLLGGLFVALFLAVPFFYYLFSAFTVGYARFTLLTCAWTIAFACKTLSERKEISRGYLDAATGLLLILQITAWVLSVWAINRQFSIYQNGYPFDRVGWQGRLWVLLFQLLIDAVGYGVLRYFFHGKKLPGITAVLVSIEAIAIGNVVIMNHGFGDIRLLENSQGRGQEIVSNETDLVEKLRRFDPSVYRLFNSTIDRNNTNLGLTVGHDSLSAFNSNYAFSLQDFIDWSHIGYTSGNWSMGEHNRRPNIEAFLGVKYYMVRRGDAQGNARDLNIPWGYRNVLDLDASSYPEEEGIALTALKEALAGQSQDGVLARDLYVNQDYVDLVFPFDNLMSSASFNEFYNTDGNEYAYLRYGIVDEESLEDPEFSAELTNAGLAVTSEATNSYRFLNPADIAFSLTQSGDSYEGTVSYLDSSASVSFQRQEDGGYLDARYGLRFSLTGTSMSFTGFNARNASAVISGDASSFTARFASPMVMRYLNPNPTPTHTVYASHWTEDGKYITGDTANTSIDHFIYPADDEFDYYAPGSFSIRGLQYYTKSVLELPNGASFAPNATPETPVYLSLITPDHYEWHLVGEDGNDVVSGLQTASTYQNYHGFTTTKPIKRIIGYLFENKEADEAMSSIIVQQQSYADYKIAIDALRAEPAFVEERRGDYARFRTSYSKPKYVVLNIPAQNGWTVSRWGKPLDQYGNTVESAAEGWQPVAIAPSQGGWIGFIAPQGESLYEARYATPSLSLGSKATLLGLVLTSFLYVCYQGTGIERIAEKGRSLSKGEKTRDIS